MLNNPAEEGYTITLTFLDGKFFYKKYKGGKYGKWKKS